MNYIRQRQLYFAAKDGRFPHLKEIVRDAKHEKSRLSNSVTENSTPLLAAIKHGYMEAVKILVEKCDCDVELAGTLEINGEKATGATPLWAAVAMKDIEFVKYLVEHRARVNIGTASKCTPLLTACYLGDIDIVKYLIENGANPNQEGEDGQTCLMAACVKDHQDIVNLLITNGANVHQKDTYGRTVLHVIAQSGHLGMMMILIAHGAKFTSSHSGRVPLWEAVTNNHKHIAEHIVSLGSSMYGTDIEIADDTNCTCLMEASLNGNLPMVQFLLRCGSNVKRKDLDGDSALHANGKNAEISDLLLGHGATMDKDFFGETPLTRVAKWGGVEVVEYLIESNRVSVTKDQQIDALELLGIAMALEQNYRDAINFWRRALQLRNTEPFLPDQRYVRHLHTDVYGNFVEITDMQQLETLSHLQNSAEEMGMQQLQIT